MTKLEKSSDNMWLSVVAALDGGCYYISWPSLGAETHRCSTTSHQQPAPSPAPSPALPPLVSPLWLARGFSPGNKRIEIDILMVDILDIQNK